MYAIIVLPFYHFCYIVSLVLLKYALNDINFDISVFSQLDGTFASRVGCFTNNDTKDD